MAYRDLTKRYVELRNAHKDVSIPIHNERSGSREQKIKLLDEDMTDHTSVVPQGSAAWTGTLAELDADLEWIRTRVLVLGATQNKRLRNKFDDDAAREQDVEIEEVTRAITEKFHKCQARLKKIAVQGNASIRDMPESEKVLRLNVMRSRANELREMSKRFHTVQRNYLSAVTRVEQVSSQLNVFDEENRDVGADLAFLTQGRAFTPEQMMRLKSWEGETEQRTREIQQIMKSVQELASLFNDLSVLIIEQGSLLDRIDYNVEQTVANLESAQEHLNKAHKHQKASSTALCIIVLVILIVVCGFILVLSNI
jgi:syntaxin 16